MYDAIIVGARCAGSPTAMLLAQKGYKVLMVDRGSFPSDIMSGHVLHPPAVAALQRWGLLDAVKDTNCPPSTVASFDLGELVLTGTPPPADGIAEWYCCRRTKLDKILVDAAVAAGAELRENVTVEDLVWENGAVTGIRTRGGSGNVTENARIVIGADGQHSFVAKAVEAPVYNEVPAVSFGYYTYWSGIDQQDLCVLQRGDRAMGIAPTNDGLHIVFYQAPIDQFREHRTDIEGHYLAAMSRAPWLMEKLSKGRREERFTGSADLQNFFRKPYGPGWALAGDAGYHKDPLTAQGIKDAFLGAEMLAEAIDDGFSGRRPLEGALAGYEQQRNEDVGPMYQFTVDMASFNPPTPEQQQLFGAMAGNQDAINRFMGIVAGTTRIPEFFSEENVGAIMAAAGARG
jgi:flavin-dependent dehydrogenase